VSHLAKNVSRFSVCNGRNFLKPPKSCHVWAKRVTIHLFMKFSCLEIVSRFGQRVTIWLGRMDINFNLENFFETLQKVAKSCHVWPKTCHDFAQYWT